MASPASLPPSAEPAPALLSAHTPRAIRDALVDAERAEFERRYAEEMAAAARTLDLTGRAELPAAHAFRDIRVQRFPVARSEFEGGSQLAPGLLPFSGQRVELGLGVLVDGELVHPATGRLWRA